MPTPDPTEDAVIARLEVAPVRWGIALAMLYVLAALLLYIAFAHPPEAVWAVFLVVMGGIALWQAERSRRAKGIHLELTRTELREAGPSGRRLARIADVRGVDRGALAFKPANGFLLRLTVKAPRGWVSGLWWGLGRTVAVGGTTPAGATRFMAEMIATLLKERAAGQDAG